MIKTKYTCPQCKNLLYSRRRKTCQFCGSKLPQELLLTEAQIKKTDAAKKKQIEELDEFRKDMYSRSAGA